MLDGFPIIGGGPAGAAGALTIARAGARPTLYEKSSFPRHKVCGEFLSPEIMPLLTELGVSDGFLALGPARVTHSELHFSHQSLRFRLPEPGWGLSRYRFDDFLLRSAVERGAELRRERMAASTAPAVCAMGRSIPLRRGRRVFGFKAHFSGPANDAVELYFFRGGYCGLCPIEGGSTNVCGLAMEELLDSHRFEMDALLGTIPRLRERLAPLARTSPWHKTGPLHCGRTPRAATPWLPAGDAACFMDPFTGSGLLAAVQTGAWAGAAVLQFAQGVPWESSCSWYGRQCSSLYVRQLSTATIIRRLLDLGWAESLSSFLPGSLLFRLTRPRAGSSARLVL